MDDATTTYTVEVRGEHDKTLVTEAHNAFREPSAQISAMVENWLQTIERNATRAPRAVRRTSTQRAA